ncbi:helix-turn-helix transcriptional regulator [Mangrovicoccus algicola]|uniref:Helix-turn-helix transcriptional regulator n=1 Tax=Mangrovicoccus algicola TaxID=2771008 RepID=A0A8J7CW51_9RHOB|nr:helix-turn-helix transcriptional regulator [Mangrovicoccus algicola]MBE3637347.1 helix-turn-helix transcriptional regulator [Mangrovicoccus algicola]
MKQQHKSPAVIDQASLPTLDEITPITTAKGETLDARQSLACTLRATTALNIEQIAEQAGYSGRAACSHFLRSDRGRMGVQAAITLHLTDAGRIGLQTMIALAQTSKSDTVRQAAAADLMDRAGLKLDQPEQPAGGAGHAAPSITINIGQPEQPVTLDVTPDEAGN